MLLRDPPDPDAWKDVPTWDGTPIMPDAWKPVSFIVRSPLLNARAPGATTGPERVAPFSLPPAKYAPVVEKVDPDAGLFEYIDGVKYIKLDGSLIPISYERHPGPQSTRPLAIPVPGLTKKTRGRTAPTKDQGVRTGTTYTCKIKDCRKTFVRSEHLKRHVRSLHTHDKPYMCALPFCDKTFARRDNLLQHERKHKDYQAYFSCGAEDDFHGVRMPNTHPLPELPPIDPDAGPWWTQVTPPVNPFAASQALAASGSSGERIPANATFMSTFQA